MRKRAVLFLAGSMLFAAPFAPRLSAQEPIVPPPDAGKPLNAIIDKSLDEVQGRLGPAEKGEAGSRALEQAGPALETKMIPLRYAQAESIIEALNEMKSPEGEIVYDEGRRAITLKDRRENIKTMAALVKKMDIFLETKVFPLGYADMDDVTPSVRDLLTDQIGRMRVNEDANTVEVTDTPAAVGAIKNLIRQKDLDNRKVSIGVKILEIILNDEHMDGIDWEAIVSDHQNVDFPGFTAESGAPSAGKLNIGTVSKEDYGILLDALDTVGVVETVLNKKINTAHGQRETVEILPIAQRNEQTAEADPVPGPNRQDSPPNTKVVLNLTPFIGEDSFLTVTIEPELDNAAGKRSDRPGVQVQLDNGATIVIGSLFEEVAVESTWKIPLLGDLPFLGGVFRNQGKEIRPAELVTFLSVEAAQNKKLP